jgi:hypothetical protein
MDELEKWLNEDATGGEAGPSSDDPWKSGASTVLAAGDTDGFDDDFSDFVSGPSSSADGPNDRSDMSHPFAQLDDDENNDDGELPSRSEIESAASRIFDASADRDRELEEDAPTFDLTRILSALQGMKEEIAGIEDESERRKAAAKVALGLVYGLEGFSETDDVDHDDSLRTSSISS